jgi:uncharacterized membrane protein YuzA (DUF378 family)
MMHKHGIMGILSSAAWLITALAAINTGTAVLGWFDFFNASFILGSMNAGMYVRYAIGAAGLWSLIGFVRMCRSCVGGECSCNCK